MEPSKPAATPLKNATNATIAGGGEPPYDGGMEHRMTAMETRLDMILPMLADIQKATAENTAAVAGLRAEMHKMNAEMKSWTLTTTIAIIGTVLATAFGISQIYRGSVPAVAPAQSAPIIITLPGTYTPATPSAPAK